MKQSANLDNPMIIRIGREELVIRRRYETLSIVNDFLIGIWFLVGSIFFLSAALTTSGTWLFILGSAQLLIRPAIRLAAHVHLRRIPAGQWESLPPRPPGRDRGGSDGD